MNCHQAIAWCVILAGLLFPQQMRGQYGLDLTSAEHTHSAEHHADLQPTTIQVGGEVRTITSASVLTPAEHAALHQVLTTGTQSLRLGASGQAIGGSLQLGALFTENASSHLVIPQGVTAIHDFGLTGNLNISGNFTNAGTFLAVSSNPDATTARIQATSIVNQQGALLSSLLPSTALPGTASYASGLNLALTALQDIINHGTISSAGNLTATAGGSIINTTLPGAGGPLPIMQALNNINLASSAGNIVNNGVISATTGNINVVSQMVHDIAINNRGGSLEAMQGALNVRSPGFSGKADLSLIGGEILAKSLNLYSGAGAVTVDIDAVLGPVNICASEAKVMSATGTLQLGRLNLSGDPLIMNRQGDVVLGYVYDDPITLIYVVDEAEAEYVRITEPDYIFGEDLTIVAGGNIKLKEGLTRNIVIRSTGHRNPVTGAIEPGGKISMHAGVRIASSPSSGPAPADPDRLGGNIVLWDENTGVGVQSLSSVDITGAIAGDITLVAHAGKGLIAAPGPTGRIILPPWSTVDALGSTQSGNVRLIAGGTNDQVTTLGTIVDTISTGAIRAENIEITTAKPMVQGGSNGYILLYWDGQTRGTFVPNFARVQLGSVRIMGPVTANSSVSIVAGKHLSVDYMGSIVARSVAVTSPAIDLGEFSTIYALAGNLDINSNGADRSLTIWMGQGANLLALDPARDVSFNQGSSGRIDIQNAGNGTITAGQFVNFNGGIDPVDVDVHNIDGTVAGSGSSFSLAVAEGNLNTGSITGDTIDLSTRAGGKGSINVTGNVTAGAAIAMRADGSITNSTKSVLTGPAITLQSNTGNIGNPKKPLEPIRISSGRLTAIATAGDIYIEQAGDVLELDKVQSSGTFRLSASGDLKIAGAAAAQEISTNTLNGGNLFLQGTLSGQQAVSLRTAGSIIQSHPGAVISGGYAFLASAIGNIGSEDSRVRTDVTELTVEAENIEELATSGHAYIHQLKPLVLSTRAYVPSGTLDVVADGTISIQNTLNQTPPLAAKELRLQATQGDIDIAGNIAASSTTLIAHGSITQSNRLVTVQSSWGVLVSRNGNIGKGAFAPIQSKIEFLTFHTAAAGTDAGNVHILQLEPLKLGDLRGKNDVLSATGNVSITALSRLWILNPVQAKSIQLIATDGIPVEKPLTASTCVVLAAGGHITGHALITAPKVSLVSLTGNIGEKDLPLKTQSKTLTTFHPLGKVYTESKGIDLKKQLGFIDLISISLGLCDLCALQPKAASTATPDRSIAAGSMAPLEVSPPGAPSPTGTYQLHQPFVGFPSATEVTSIQRPVAMQQEQVTGASAAPTFSSAEDGEGRDGRRRRSIR